MANIFERSFWSKQEKTTAPSVSEGAKAFLNKQKEMTDPEKKVEEYFKQEDTQKNLAKEASLEKKETAIRIKDIKDTKTLAAIEFLGETSPAWAERFGDLSSMDAKISANAIDAVKIWMANPDNRYENGKWISGSIEQAQEKRAAKEKVGKEMADKVVAAEKFFNKIPDTEGRWGNLLGKMSPEDKQEFFARFAKDPESVMKSASYDAKKKEFISKAGYEFTK